MSVRFVQSIMVCLLLAWIPTAGALLIKMKNFLALSANACEGKQQVMRNGATDLEVLIEQNAKDGIPLPYGNLGIEIPLGGRPGDFENYYDRKTGWPLNPNGGNKYLTALTRVKVILLSARTATTRREVEAALQEAIKIVLEVLGEVDPNEEKSL